MKRPAPTPDPRQEASERRQKWARRLEDLTPATRQAEYEAARRAYNAATTALDEIEANQPLSIPL